MYYGKGRLWGNMGTYVMEESQDAWEAYRLAYNAMVTKEHVQLPPKLSKVPPHLENSVYDAIAISKFSGRSKVYNLGYGLHFLEFIDPTDLGLKQKH